MEASVKYHEPIAKEEEDDSMTVILRMVRITEGVRNVNTSHL